MQETEKQNLFEKLVKTACDMGQYTWVKTDDYEDDTPYNSIITALSDAGVIKVEG